MKASYRDSLESYLKALLKLDDLLAAFLADNLHHLNDTSAELLESLDNSMLMTLRCSTICLVNTP
jgi:hypothetical protein